LPSTQLFSIIYLIWQCIWASEGNLQTSSIKYIKWAVHNSFYVFYTAAWKWPLGVWKFCQHNPLKAKPKILYLKPQFYRAVNTFHLG
jgi:hypothetical protein